MQLIGCKSLDTMFNVQVFSFVACYGLVPPNYLFLQSTGARTAKDGRPFPQFCYFVFYFGRFKRSSNSQENVMVLSTYTHFDLFDYSSSLYSLYVYVTLLRIAVKQNDYSLCLPILFSFTDQLVCTAASVKRRFAGW